MTEFIYLNKDDLLKSNLLVFSNLSLYSFFKILFKYKKKDKFICIFINKPKMKLYYFLIRIGFKIRLFDWNLFKFEERFESHNQSYAEIEKFYDGVKSHTSFSNLCIESLYNNSNKINAAPRKFFINFLFEYLNFILIAKKIYNENKRCIFYSTINLRLTDKIYKKQFNSTLKDFHFIKYNSFTSRISDFILSIITKGSYICLLLLSIFYVLLKLRINFNKVDTYYMAYRLYNSGFRFYENEKKIDWLLDNDNYNFDEKNSIFVAEDKLDKNFLTQIKNKKYNFTTMNLWNAKFVRNPLFFFSFFTKNVFFIIYQSLFCKNYQVLYYLVAVYYFLKWSYFVQNYKPNNYLSYHDHGIQHIFRNTILSKINCNQLMYKHTYCENNYNIHNKTSNILYAYLSYDKEFHWGERSILMSKQNHSQSLEHVITKPTHVNINKDKIEFNNIDNNNIVLSAFASTFANNCVNDDKSHQYFLESLYSLINNESKNKKISRIIYKGKTPFDNFTKSSNTELVKISLKIKKLKNFIIFDSSYSALDLIKKSDISVSMSFSSTSIEALCIGKRGFYFDCSNQFTQSYYDKMPSLVAHNHTEFLNCLEYWINIDKFSLKNYYDNYFKKEFGNHDLKILAQEVIKNHVKMNSAR